MTTALTPAQFLDYWQQAMPLDAYFPALEAYVQDPTDPQQNYLKVNKARAKRILGHTVLSEATLAALNNGHKVSKLLIINEFWCGDGAQILPVIGAMITASQGTPTPLEARVIFRDQHLELIDQFLTNGKSRSIPIVIFLDDACNYLSHWGPRPADAQAMVVKLKYDPSTAASYSEHLHAWYAADKQRAIQDELVGVMERFKF